MARPKKKETSTIVYTRLDPQVYQSLARKSLLERRPMSTTLAMIAEEYFKSEQYLKGVAAEAKVSS